MAKRSRRKKGSRTRFTPRTKKPRVLVVADEMEVTNILTEKLEANSKLKFNVRATDSSDFATRN